MFRQSPAPWYTPQGLRDLLPSASVLLTVAGLLMSLLMAVLPGNPETEDPGDPDTGYVQPAPDVQAGLENIRTDINAALIELRHKEGVPPLFPATPATPSPRAASPSVTVRCGWRSSSRRSSSRRIYSGRCEPERT